MRKLVMGFLLLFMAFGASAQSPLEAKATIYKDWSNHIESKNIVDVSYRLLSCKGTNQVHFLLFNENSIDQKVDFSVTLTNDLTKASVIKQLSFPAKKMTVYKAECDDDAALSGLKLALPQGFDPAHTSVKVTFK